MLKQKLGGIVHLNRPRRITFFPQVKGQGNARLHDAKLTNAIKINLR